MSSTDWPPSSIKRPVDAHSAVPMAIDELSWRMLAQSIAVSTELAMMMTPSGFSPSAWRARLEKTTSSLDIKSMGASNFPPAFAKTSLKSLSQLSV